MITITKITFGTGSNFYLRGSRISELDASRAPKVKVGPPFCGRKAWVGVFLGYGNPVTGSRSMCVYVRLVGSDLPRYFVTRLCISVDASIQKHPYGPDSSFHYTQFLMMLEPRHLGTVHTVPEALGPLGINNTVSHYRFTCQKYPGYFWHEPLSTSGSLTILLHMLNGERGNSGRRSILSCMCRSVWESVDAVIAGLPNPDRIEWQGWIFIHVEVGLLRRK